MYTPPQWKYELMFLGSESDSAYPQSFSCWSQACGFLGGRVDVEEARRVRHVHPPALRAGQNAGGEHEHACPVSHCQRTLAVNLARMHRSLILIL